MAPHVTLAATVAGKTFGVAKKANVIAVRVLDDDGFGSESYRLYFTRVISNGYPVCRPVRLV